MSIHTTKVIDWLGIEKETGDVVLDLLDEEDWQDENEHLALLQKKLNAYLAFIEADGVYQELQETLDRTIPRATPIKVAITARYEPTARARAFLEYAQKTFKNAGFTLTHRVRLG